MPVGLPVKSAGGTHSASEFNKMTAFVDNLEVLINSNAGGISTNASNISTNASNISGNSSAITTNGTNISTNASNISTNASSISTNAGNISVNTAAIATNASAISGKADASHTHTALEVTDFDAEVSNNTDVAANTAERHTANTDTILDAGGLFEVDAEEIHEHLNDSDLHRTINDVTSSATGLWSSDKIQKHAGVQTIDLSDTNLNYALASHSNRLIVCGTPTANRTIDIDSANVSQDDHFRILAVTDSGFQYQITESGSTTLHDFDGNTLTSPYSMEDGMYFVHLDQGVNRAYIQKLGSGSGGGTTGDLSVFRAKKSGTQSITAGAWADVVFWTQDAMTDGSAFSFNTTTGELTVNVTTKALFYLDVVFEDTALDRVEGFVGLSINTGGGHVLDNENTHSFYATRNASVDKAGGGTAILVDVTAGDKFKFQTKTENNDAEILGDFARFQAVLLTGAVGPTGPAGGNEKLDGVFRIQNTADDTKEIDFDASAITTATKRTISMPDRDVDLADIAQNTSDIAALNSYESNVSTAAVVAGTNWGTPSGSSPAYETRKDSDDRIWLTGQIRRSTGSTLNCGTVASGYRPPVNIYGLAINGTALTTHVVRIQTGGLMTILSGTYTNNDVLDLVFTPWEL